MWMHKEKCKDRTGEHKDQNNTLEVHNQVVTTPILTPYNTIEYKIPTNSSILSWHWPVGNVLMILKM